MTESTDPTSKILSITEKKINDLDIQDHEKAKWLAQWILAHPVAKPLVDVDISANSATVVCDIVSDTYGAVVMPRLVASRIEFTKLQAKPADTTE